MVRPCKLRRICAIPECGQFGPKTCSNKNKPLITMGLDEYETIRLIDWEGQTQEECAAQMNIARTTVQAIYTSARRKLAESLVTGAELNISGGNYELCNRVRRNSSCKCHCPRQCGKNLGGNTMKIAVTYENGQIFQHFGHTENFKIYNVQGNKIISSSVVNTNGQGHGALADFLVTNNVDTLICGGIGGGARQALDEAGIKLFGGVTGEADAAVEALLSGKLNFDPDVMCQHHEENENHHCGEHGCGEHNHCHQ